MGEGWSDWYAVDYGDKLGYFFDTPADGDAVVFRYSSGDQLAFRTAAVDCPVGGPGSRTAQDRGPTRAMAATPTVTSARSSGVPEVHADGEIWVQTLWDLRSAIGTNVTDGS